MAQTTGKMTECGIINVDDYVKFAVVGFGQGFDDIEIPPLKRRGNLYRGGQLRRCCRLG